MGVTGAVDGLRGDFKAIREEKQDSMSAGQVPDCGQQQPRGGDDQTAQLDGHAHLKLLDIGTKGQLDPLKIALGHQFLVGGLGKSLGRRLRLLVGESPSLKLLDEFKGVKGDDGGHGDGVARDSAWADPT